jgi:hypothetical protein
MNVEEQRLQALREIAVNKMHNATRYVWVTFQRAGFHHYPAANTEVSLEDVKYLGHTHRHLFKFRVAVEIFHNDREIEFHQLLNYCESLFGTHIDIDHKSVEMLADDLYSTLAIRYPGRKMVIEVSEDGECGCRIEY